VTTALTGTPADRMSYLASDHTQTCIEQTDPFIDQPQFIHFSHLHQQSEWRTIQETATIKSRDRGSTVGLKPEVTVAGCEIMAKVKPWDNIKTKANYLRPRSKKRHQGS